jgi:uncharacterized protein YidB (DUF937 family)
MDLKSLATQLIMNKIGAANDASAAESAVGELLGGTDGFDLGSLVGQLTGAGGDIAQKAQSWLGDGANESISSSQLQAALGADKIDAFAQKLGINREQASSGLAETLPQLIDKGSRGGSLLDSAGGPAGLIGLASKFFK